MTEFHLKIQPNPCCDPAESPQELPAVIPHGEWPKHIMQRIHLQWKGCA